MPHLFLNRPSFNGDQRFQTHSAILDTIPYSPKVLIIGTYNDGAAIGNTADFFYGRNFFWPVISNLSNNANLLTQRRDTIGIPPGNPNLGQILQLCEKFKLAFADLITDVLVALPNHNDNHLNAALGVEMALPNEQNIVDFINNTPSITHVFATTKFGNNINLNTLWQDIIAESRIGVLFGSILTPSGMGGIPNFVGLRRAATIARYWLWVNHPNNPYGDFINQEGYTHFDHTWLMQCGVNPDLF